MLSNLSQGDRIIFKLESGEGFDSVWQLKSNFPIELKVTAEELGHRYGEGKFVVAENYRYLNITPKTTFIEKVEGESADQ